MWVVKQTAPGGYCGGLRPEPGPKGVSPMDTNTVAQTTTREQPEHDRRDRKEGDRLYDVLAALPFEQRIEAIEKMAERMGV